MSEEAAHRPRPSVTGIDLGRALVAGLLGAGLAWLLAGPGPTRGATSLALLGLSLCGALLQGGVASRLLPAVVVGVGLGAQLAIQQRTHLELFLDLRPYIAGADVLPRLLEAMARCARDQGGVAVGAAVVVAGLRLPGARVAVPALALGGLCDLVGAGGLYAAAEGLEQLRLGHPGAPSRGVIAWLARAELLAPLAALGVGLVLLLRRRTSLTELALSGVVAVLLWPPLSLAATWLDVPDPGDASLRMSGGAVVSMDLAPSEPELLAAALEVRGLHPRERPELWACAGAVRQPWLRRLRGELALSPPPSSTVAALAGLLEVMGRHGQYRLFLVGRLHEQGGVLGPWLSLGGEELHLDRPPDGLPEWVLRAGAQVELLSAGAGGPAGLCALSTGPRVTVQELVDAARALRQEPSCRLGIAWTVLGVLDGPTEREPCP